MATDLVKVQEGVGRDLSEHSRLPQFLIEAATMEVRTRPWRVIDELSEAAAVEVVARVRELKKEVELERKEKGAPYAQAKKIVDAEYKRVKELLEKVDVRLGGEYQRYKANKRAAFERAEAAGRANGVAAVEAGEVVVKPEPPPNVARTESGKKVYEREDITWEVTDMEKLARAALDSRRKLVGLDVLAYNREAVDKMVRSARRSDWAKMPGIAVSIKKTLVSG